MDFNNIKVDSLTEQGIVSVANAIKLQSEISILIKILEKEYRNNNEISDCKAVIFNKSNSDKFGIKYYDSLDYFMNLLIDTTKHKKNEN